MKVVDDPFSLKLRIFHLRNNIFIIAEVIFQCLKKHKSLRRISFFNVIKKAIILQEFNKNKRDIRILSQFDLHQ